MFLFSTDESSLVILAINDNANIVARIREVNSNQAFSLFYNLCNIHVDH